MDSSRTSLASERFGISKDNSATKWTVEIYGWLLFDVTFIAGWIAMDVSIANLLCGEGVRGAERLLSSLVTPQFGIFNSALVAMIETIYIALFVTMLSISRHSY